MKYIFLDLDNTICESKQLVELPMLRTLEILNASYKVIIVSGAEYSRMIVQAPLSHVAYMAQNGNETYDGELLWKNDFENKDDVRRHIFKICADREMCVNDDMVDDRGSQISFSFIGHHAPFDKKKRFDPDRTIRMGILDKFPFPQALIGGTTCIDYVPFTKGQNIARYLKQRKIKSSDCLYIGDAFIRYGNDETVMGVLPVYQVRSPLETRRFIEQFI